MTDDDFFGVPNSYVMDLGRLVVAAAVLEDATCCVAEALDLKVRAKTFADCVDEIKKAVRDKDVPPWARVTKTDVRQWCIEAVAAMKQRNEYLHSTYLQQLQDGGWSPQRRPIRKAGVYDLDRSGLQSVVAMLTDVLAGQRPLVAGLLPEIREGVYAHYFDVDVEHSGAAVVYQRAVGGYPLRPTNDEIDAAIVRASSLLGG